MTRSESMQMTKTNEGFSYRIYLDTMGVPTVGYGTALYLGKQFTKEVLEQMFEFDYLNAELEYEKLELNLDPVRRAVVVDMIYNMGLEKVLKFRRMLAALKVHDWVAAERELKDSKYYQQVKGRSERNAKMILTGENQ